MGPVQAQCQQDQPPNLSVGSQALLTPQGSPLLCTGCCRTGFPWLLHLLTSSLGKQDILPVPSLQPDFPLSLSP